MALKHDAQGFLVGDPIDLSKAVADWAAIRDDVRAIRQAVLGIESALNRDAPEARASVPATPGRGAGLEEADPTVKAFNEVAQPMARDARQGADTARAPQNPQAVPARQALTGQPAQAARRERQIPVLLRAPAVPQTGGAGGNAARRDTESAAAITRAVAELRATRQAVTPAPAQPMGRDSRGRFVRGAAAARPAAGGGRGAGAGGPTDGERDGQDESALRSLGDRIVGAFKESGAGLEEADPTVKAFNEVAQPMARGYELLTGGDSQKKQEGWLRRIYGSLTGFRKDEGLFNKVAAKRLKAIEEKPVAEAGGGGGLFGGLLGMLGGLLKRIPGVGALAAGAGGLLARGGGLLAGAGRMAAGAGRGLLGLGRGALRRIPIIGALLGGIGAATDIYDSETDDTLTRREKDQRTGKAVGGLAGTMGGMFAGAKLGAMVGAFAGPVGAAIGGAIGGAAGLFFGDQAGQIIGTTVGGWVSDLRDADIPGKIAAAWTATTEAVMSAWNATVEGVKKGWDSVVSGFTAVGDGIGKAWGGFVDAAKAGWESFTGLFASIFDALKSIPVVGPAIEAAQAAMEKAADAVGGVVAGAKEMAGAAATAVKEKAVELGTKAAEGVKSGVEYLGNNTTVGKGIKAAGQGAAAIAEKAPAAAERAYNVTAAAAGSALEAIMPKGYRHKALFDGIKGGDSLTKYGSYTDEEAALVRELKTSGANTSANVKGGMSLEVQGKISAQAKRAGLDPVMMQKIAAMESGGNANAISSTGAIGIYQFTGQTASGVGIKNRFDVDQNIEGGMKLTKQNQAMLEDAKLPVTAENLYMMHQLGPKAAKEVIRGAASGKSKEELSADTQKAMNLNYGAKSKTAADYIATNKKALDDRYAAVTKDAGGAQTAVAKADSPSPAAGQVAAVSPAQPPAPAAKPAAVPAEPANPAVAQAVTPPATPNYVGPTATPVVAAVAVPPVPAGPQAAPVAEAPQVTVPMASNSARQPAVVVAGGGEVGQDLRERGIAHIATGGLGGA